MDTNTDDILSAIITDRLGERQKKIDRMKEWDRKDSFKSSALRFGYIVTTIAACALAVWVLYPVQNKNMEMLEDLGIVYSKSEFRAALQDMSEISNMIESKKYDDALIKTKDLMSQSDLVIDEFDGVGFNWNDEEQVYALKEEKLANHELRWTYIYLLVCTDDRREAIKQLKIYLKDKDYCEYETEAKKLLNELKKKS